MAAPEQARVTAPKRHSCPASTTRCPHADSRDSEPPHEPADTKGPTEAADLRRSTAEDAPESRPFDSFLQGEERKTVWEAKLSTGDVGGGRVPTDCAHRPPRAPSEQLQPALPPVLAPHQSQVWQLLQGSLGQQIGHGGKPFSAGGLRKSRPAHLVVSTSPRGPLPLLSTCFVKTIGWTSLPTASRRPGNHDIAAWVQRQ